MPEMLAEATRSRWAFRAPGRGAGGSARACRGRLRCRQPPASVTAGNAPLLLLECFGRRIQEAEDLIHRQTFARVAAGEPALTVVGASGLVVAPVAMFTRIFVQFRTHGLMASRSTRRARLWVR